MMHRLLEKSFVLVSLAIMANQAHSNPPAWPPTPELDHVLVQTSLYTRHFDADPEHNNHQKLISLEFHTPNAWLAGGARFQNSYAQESIYLYVGREFPLWQFDHDLDLRAKLTAGLLHGYRGEYQDKIPFNNLGIAPAALPSIGMRWGRIEGDLILFGGAGMMVTAGLRLCHFSLSSDRDC